MFESVAITSRLQPKVNINLGDLAQSLLYYGQVNLVGNGGLIASLAGSVGTLQTLELIERGYLRVRFEGQMLGIRTVTGPDGQPVHDIIKMGVVEKGPADLIQRALEVAGWDRYQAKIAANRFAKKIEIFEYPNYDGHLSRQSLLDNEVARSIIPVYFDQFGASDAIPNDFRFEVQPAYEGLRVETNIQFDRATASYRQSFRLNKEEVTPALVLDALRQVYDQQYIAAALESEVLATPLLMSADAGRLAQVVKRAANSSREIEVFEDFVFEGSSSLNKVIGGGKRSFDEFLKLLEQSRKFRGWIANQPPDAKLLAEYHRRIAERTVLEKLPAKSVRFFVFTGGGLLAEALIGGGVGTAIGVGLSAADSFLLDKLGLGWKPHHFVTKEYRDFVKGVD